MSAQAAPAVLPPWLHRLAPDAIMISSVLGMPVVGKDTIMKVVQTASGLYSRHTVLYSATLDERELLEYDALIPGGVAIHGVVTLRSDAAGRIVEVGVHHGPLGAVNTLSAALEEALAADLGAGYFQR